MTPTSDEIEVSPASIDDDKAYGANRLETPKPDNDPLTMILPADMFVAVVIFA